MEVRKDKVKCFDFYMVTLRRGLFIVHFSLSEREGGADMAIKCHAEQDRT